MEASVQQSLFNNKGQTIAAKTLAPACCPASFAYTQTLACWQLKKANMSSNLMSLSLALAPSKVMQITRAEIIQVPSLLN